MKGKRDLLAGGGGGGRITSGAPAGAACRLSASCAASCHRGRIDRRGWRVPPRSASASQGGSPAEAIDIADAASSNIPAT